ncbi:hypothetical protein EYF80_066822 [Liparis tanakae]|uniref:Uncharacterized protein n=1 Tax=Liparis tanakae TaxID=230148 RepID=A0A4Z2E2W5_9TELE|nr:hypothetical protein EYF80_066822 [Liparis tanakae]
MWADSGSGRPFLSQLSWGGGEPAATHSMLTEPSRTVVSRSPPPPITGGAAGNKRITTHLKQLQWR